jgi:hypothetical protein
MEAAKAQNWAVERKETKKLVHKGSKTFNFMSGNEIVTISMKMGDINVKFSIILMGKQQICFIHYFHVAY